MSVNLEIHAEVEGGGNAVLLLLGFTRGITHSATVGIGDKVRFGNQQVIIADIVHGYSPSGSEIAPTSYALARPIEAVEDLPLPGMHPRIIPLTQEAMDELVGLGFQAQ